MRRILLVLLLGALGGLVWLVRTGGLYEAGSDFGYNLGLVGGLLMLSLLLYPLRKRIPHLAPIGRMDRWFRYHMFAGITGPLLVLFHSTFRVGSLNGSMALYSMLLVALSGLIGRFIYRHIHRGLYGHRLTIDEVSADLAQRSEEMLSVFALDPNIEPRLHAFKDAAFASGLSYPRRLWRFLMLRWWARQLAGQVREDAKRALRRAWRKQGGGDKAAFLYSYKLARRHIQHYLDAVVSAAQFSLWEKLFSYWHVIHIPFLYLLVFSGVVHVLAVHIY